MKYLYKRLSAILILSLVLSHVNLVLPVHAMNHPFQATSSDGYEKNNEISIEREWGEDEEISLLDDRSNQISKLCYNGLISKQDALDQALRLVDKSEAEIENREILHDIYGDNSYEILTFSTGGYLIRRTDYSVVLEFSDNPETKHPYELALENKKYYAGAMNYLYEVDGHIFKTYDQELEVQLEMYTGRETLILDYSRRVGKYIVEDVATSSDLLASSSDATNSNSRFAPFTIPSHSEWKVISKESELETMPFGYNEEHSIYSGTCGTLAASMLLTFYHYNHINILPVKLTPIHDLNGPDSVDPSGKSDQHNLLQFLLDNYAFEYAVGSDGTVGTTADIDVRMLNTFIGTELRDSNIHVVKYGGLSDIKKSIDKDEPIAVSACVDTDPTGSLPGLDFEGGHVVIAYGYKDEYVDMFWGTQINTYLKVHFGWHGAKYVSRDGYADQKLIEIWLAPIDYDIYSTYKLEETVKHTHTAYDTTTHFNKNNVPLFSCVEPSCNALIPDDYSNYQECAESVWLGDHQISLPGQINYADDIDYFRAYASRAGYLDICADFTDENAAELILYDKDGKVIKTVTNALSGTGGKSYGIQSWQVDQGSYYIGIRSGTEGDYQISFSLASEANPLVLLDTGGNNNMENIMHQIVVPHKGRVDIRVTFDHDPWPWGILELYDQNQKLIASGSGFTEGEVRGYRISDPLVEPGVYTVVIYSRKAGSYHVSAVISSKDDYGDTRGTAETVRLNSSGKLSVSGRVNYSWDDDYFRFEVPHKGRITLKSVMPDTEFGNIYLYDENGKHLDTGWGFIDGEDRGYRISEYLIEPGMYYLMIHSREAGDYQLNVSLTSKDDYGDTVGTAEPIRLNSNGEGSVSGKINYSSDKDYFRIDIPHKGRVTIHSVMPAMTSGDLYLYDENEVLVGYSQGVVESSGSGYRISDQLIEPGTYYFLVYSRETGDYQVNVSLTSKDDYGDTMETAEPFRLNSDGEGSIGGKINYSSDKDYFRIVIPHKGKVTIQSVMPATTSGDLYLYDENGVVVSSGRGFVESSGNGYRISNCRIDPGTYYVLIDSREVGDYRLSINLTE